MAADSDAAMTDAPPAAAPAGDAAPKRTLYVKNLPDKLKKERLRRSLHAAFSPCGRILAIIVGRRAAMRGQAFVGFDSVEAATAAKRQLQGFVFFDKPMVIEFARSDCAPVAMHTGEGYTPRERRARSDEEGPAGEAPTEAAAAAAPAEPAPKRARDDNFVVNHTPSNTLLAQGLPEDADAKALLEPLFQRYAGFTQVRPVPGRNMAFVEYQSEPQATAALAGLANFKLSATQRMRLTYAKA